MKNLKANEEKNKKIQVRILVTLLARDWFPYGRRYVEEINVIHCSNNIEKSKLEYFIYECLF